MKKLLLPSLLAAAVLALAVPAARAIPVIQHEPVTSAEQGRPLGLRATVHDTAARVVSVTLFYTTSKGSTPFRAAMTASGAGLWFGTIPGHLVGPGKELFYYLQAENADGETRDTPWQTVRVLPPQNGGAAAIPSASAVADRAQASAVPANAARPDTAASAAPAKPDNSKKYWVTAGIIAGGAVAVGGAIALANGSSGGGGHGSGGGGSSSEKIEDGTYGGNYNLTFTPDNATATSVPAYDSGIASVYVKGSSVEVVGLWGSEIFSGSLSGNMFSAAKNVPARNAFPAAYVSVSASFSGSSCTVTINGTSTDPATPGTFNGSYSGTRH